MEKQRISFLFLFLISISFASASVWDYLTIGQANQYYCQLGFCGNSTDDFIGTKTDTKYCTWDAAGNEIDCDSDGGAGGGFTNGSDISPRNVNTTGNLTSNGAIMSTGNYNKSFNMTYPNVRIGVFDDYWGTIAVETDTRILGGANSVWIIDNGGNNLRFYDAIVRRSYTRINDSGIDEKKNVYVNQTTFSRYFCNFDGTVCINETNITQWNQNNFTMTDYVDDKCAGGGFTNGTPISSPHITADNANITNADINRLTANTIVDRSLIAYYSFSNKTAKDLSIYGNDCTFAGNAHSREDVLEVDGSGDYADCGNQDSLNVKGNLTISVWYKPNNVESAGLWDRIVAKGANTQYEIAISNQLNYGIIFRFVTTGTKTHTTNVGIPYNEWSHIATTYDGANAKVYINGDEIYSGAEASGHITSTVSNLIIGDWSTAGREANGSIDNVRIYNKSLTIGEIRTLYSLENKRRAEYDKLAVRNLTADFFCDNETGVCSTFSEILDDDYNEQANNSNQMRTAVNDSWMNFKFVNVTDNVSSNYGWFGVDISSPFNVWQNETVIYVTTSSYTRYNVRNGSFQIGITTGKYVTGYGSTVNNIQGAWL